ncbi:penicillin acylase family protein, partial [candidate division KSB1 bacterium]|nr:penicillin acylase family protein [candidate division KSB1 bacterium]
EVRKVKLKVKIGLLKLPVTKTFYWGKHGAVLKNKTGFYAVRFPANMGIKAAEQWHTMNKARNFTEFKNALNIRGLPGMNIVYADKNDTIYYLDNANMPRRIRGYDWNGILPGVISSTRTLSRYQSSNGPGVATLRKRKRKLL